MITCYHCVHFLPKQHLKLPYPEDFYACDSTDMLVVKHIDILESRSQAITPDNVGYSCPGFRSDADSWFQGEEYLESYQPSALSYQPNKRGDNNAGL